MKNYNQVIHELGENRVRRDEILAPYTTIKIGGPADLFFEAVTVDNLVKAVGIARKHGVAFFVLGGGTNLIISDKGFRGLVIRNKTSNIQPVKLKGTSSVDAVYIKVESGVQVNRLVRYALNEGLARLEYFLGQPGTVGGAMWINAHNMWAGRKFFGDNVVEAEVLDKQVNRKTVPVSYFNFGYDRSLLQESGDIVLTVTLALKKGDKEQLWQSAQETLNYRRETQPLNYLSSGCSFRNISPEEARRIGTPNNTTSTGFLIDSLGLKGTRIGGAEFSKKHAAFILNVDNAKAADVKALLDLAKEKIQDRYGIEVREEIVLLGEF